MSKLIISGNKTYTKRMYNHLRKEHPSTRHRMILKDKLSFTKEQSDSLDKIFVNKTKHYRPLCDICNTKMIKSRYTDMGASKPLYYCKVHGY